MLPIRSRTPRRRRRQFAAMGALLLSQCITAFSPSSHGRVRHVNLGIRSRQLRLDEKLHSTTPRTRTEPNDQQLPVVESASNNIPKMEMSTMSTVGFLISFGVILILSMSNDSLPSAEELKSRQGFEILGDSFETAGRNVLKASMPQSATDVVSVAVGEGIAGVIGAVASLIVSFLLRLQMSSSADEKRMEGGVGAVNKQEMLRSALADGDYFVTRAAALPLFESLGLSPLAATVTSVILASVPYEFIKLGSSREKARFEEELLLEKLLQEEQEKKRQQNGLFSRLSNGRTESVVTTVDLKSLIPAKENKPIDFVELFADITKWLEYDVLKTDLSGRLVWNGQVLASNVDSALFGFFAALSSQLYADIIYRYTDYGTEEKRTESRERSLGGWLKLYATTSLNSAVLFGVYATVKNPVGSAIAGFLSGGVDSCIGSQDYKTCMDAYMLSNPPQADTAAQLRSLATAFVSLLDRLQTDASLDKQEFTRSLVVQLYSFMEQIFTFSLSAVEVVSSGQYLYN